MYIKTVKNESDQFKNNSVKIEKFFREPATSPCEKVDGGPFH